LFTVISSAGLFWANADWMAYRIDPWGTRIPMFRLWLWEQITLSAVIGIVVACVLVVVFKAFWMVARRL
jgi:hypothetical protein